MIEAHEWRQTNRRPVSNHRARIETAVEDHLLFAGDGRPVSNHRARIETRSSLV